MRCTQVGMVGWRGAYSELTLGLVYLDLFITVQQGGVVGRVSINPPRVNTARRGWIINTTRRG